MSVLLANLIARTAKTAVRVENEIINIEYKPGVITQRYLQETRKKTTAEVLCEVITGWDLTLDGTEKVQLTPDGLETIPAFLLNLIWFKIFNEISNPHEDEEKKDSGDGLLPAEK